MQFRRIRKVMAKSLALIALLFASGGVARAAVILQVNVSNPSAVVFKSTAAFADNTVLDVDSGDGILLSGFFSGNALGLGGALDAGAINVFDSTAGTSRDALDRVFVGTPFLDLNLYATAGAFDMSFLNSKRALTGLASEDLSSLTGLPTVGTVGNIFAGGLVSSNIIGQYQVVPEPSTAALTALGLIGLAARRRRS